MSTKKFRVKNSGDGKFTQVIEKNKIVTDDTTVQVVFTNGDTSQSSFATD